MVSMCGFSEDLKMACKVSKVFSFCLFVSWWNNMLTDTGAHNAPVLCRSDRIFVELSGQTNANLYGQRAVSMID